MIIKLICRIFNLIHINEYESLKNYYSNQISILTNQINENSKNYKSIISELEEKINCIKRQKNDLIAKCKVLTFDNEQLILQTNTLSKDLHNESVLLNNSKKDIENFKEQIKLLLNDCEKYKNQLLNLEKEYRNSIDIKDEEYKRNILNLNIKNAELLKESNLHITDIKKSYNEIKRENNTLHNILNHYKTKLEKLEVEKDSSISRLQTELDNTTNQYNEIQLTLSEELNKLKIALEEIIQFKIKLKNKDEEIINLQSSIKEYNQKLTEERDLHNDIRKSLNNENNILKNEIQKRDHKIEELSNINKKYRQQSLENYKTTIQQENTLNQYREIQKTKNRHISENNLENSTLQHKKQRERIHSYSSKKESISLQNNNLNLTENIDIAAIINDVKGLNSKSSIKNKTEIYQHPKIKFIIDKLAKLKIELVYWYEKFYIKKNGQLEPLKFQNLSIYNNIILLLYDGKTYAGYDMNTGKLISRPTKNNNLLIAELDEYYKCKYGKEGNKRIY